MNNPERKGMLVAGSWILDKIQVIDGFPVEQSLVNITDSYVSNGGSAYNVLIALRKLSAPFPLEALGLLGDDEEGRHIVEDCRRYSINADKLHITTQAPTSHTIVMSVKESGRRTFLHYRGANALLSEHHFDLTLSNARMLHLGYLLLLDQLDKIVPGKGTGASRILKQAKEAGMLTSVDLVSEDSDRFTKIIPYTLPYIDYLFLNEYEAAKLSGINLSEQDENDRFIQQCRLAAKAIFKMGLRQYIFIHFPKGLIAIHKEGHEIIQPGLQIPEHLIKGANGAGDALAAGILFGIHERWPLKEAVKLGVCAAASCLFHVTCSEGILPYKQCLAMADQFDYSNLLKRSK